MTSDTSASGLPDSAVSDLVAEQAVKISRDFEICFNEGFEAVMTYPSAMILVFS